MVTLHMDIDENNLNKTEKYDVLLMVLQPRLLWDHSKIYISLIENCPFTVENCPGMFFVVQSRKSKNMLFTLKS